MSKTFQMSGQKGQVDDKGVVTWTIPYFVEELSEVFSVGVIPPVEGLREVGRSWTDIEGAGLQVEVEYEGVFGDPEEKEETYDYDSSFKEETLLAHPLWPQIRDFYKGTYDKEDKRIEFEEYLSNSSRGLSSTGNTGTGDPGKRKNPMYGLETFLSLASVFRRTYLRANIPAGLLDKVGTIQDSLPGGFPTPPGRDWIIMPPKITQRGGVFQITEELMLSQPGGWPKKVYALIQI
jgi:hypothetical protein